MTREVHIGEVREVDEAKRQLLVVPIVYGPLDSWNTSWAPGVFTDRLRERKQQGRMPIFTWRHDREPLGTLTEFSDGPSELSGVVQLDDFDAVPLAKRAFVQYRSGTLHDVSVEFDREKDEADTRAQGARRILKADMPSLGAVMEGAVQGARVVAVREAVQADPEVISKARVVDLAHRLAAGSLTLEQVLGALGLEASAVEVVVDTPTVEEVDTEAAALEGDIDAALALVTGGVERAWDVMGERR